MSEEKLSDESTNGEVLREQDLGSKSDVSTELVPLVSSELESLDETLRDRMEGMKESVKLRESRRKDRNGQLTR